MTTYETPELTFPSAPIEGDTKATVDLVANDWRSDEDWDRFVSACFQAASMGDGLGFTNVNPNEVRAFLTNAHGLTIEPRRYSAFWSRAAGKNGFLVAATFNATASTRSGAACSGCPSPSTTGCSTALPTTTAGGHCSTAKSATPHDLPRSHRRPSSLPATHPWCDRAATSNNQMRSPDESKSPGTDLRIRNDRTNRECAAPAQGRRVGRS